MVAFRRAGSVLAQLKSGLACCRSDVENQENANGGSILPCRYVTRAEMPCCHTHSWLDTALGPWGGCVAWLTRPRAVLDADAQSWGIERSGGSATQAVRWPPRKTDIPRLNQRNVRVDEGSERQIDQENAIDVAVAISFKVQRPGTIALLPLRTAQVHSGDPQ